jgi:hypothetical protein
LAIAWSRALSESSGSFLIDYLHREEIASLFRETANHIVRANEQVTGKNNLPDYARFLLNVRRSALKRLLASGGERSPTGAKRMLD